MDINLPLPFLFSRIHIFSSSQFPIEHRTATYRCCYAIKCPSYRCDQPLFLSQYRKTLTCENKPFPVTLSPAFITSNSAQSGLLATRAWTLSAPTQRWPTLMIIADIWVMIFVIKPSTTKVIKCERTSYHILPPIIVSNNKNEEEAKVVDVQAEAN